MTSRLLDFDDGRKKSCEQGKRLREMVRLVREREMQLESLESLLDRILICLNSYRDGEIDCTADSLVEAVAREISFYRLLTTDAAASEV